MLQVNKHHNIINVQKNECSFWTLQKITYKSVNKLLVFIKIKASVRWQQRKSKYKIEETEQTI